MISRPSANIAIERTTPLFAGPWGLDRVGIEQASDDAGRGELFISHHRLSKRTSTDDEHKPSF
jgi:hypothetical protein